MSALPLKVSSTSTPSKLANGASSSAASPSQSKPGAGVTDPADISSPHELTAYVENLLEQLDAKFDDMSSQILERSESLALVRRTRSHQLTVVNFIRATLVMQMSSRVDALEASIQDIINGDLGGTSTPGHSIPPSPAPGTTSTPIPVRRAGSGLQ
ncbi:hypothetical protein EVG20_g5722 [Dentipellis fragilis]|uniref:Uncharacterized protein n=1 Tax=Dentipellis fragilis TaxID=205917 RepID=A0A4Y9YRR7_9AGAM|nr:hypothetical protein EVG20_g5722 [Dentipellis fragilis]